MDVKRHSFVAVAFVQNFSLHALAAGLGLPEGKLGAQDLRFAPACGGMVFLYSFGAAAFWNVPAAGREAELERLHRLLPELPREVQREDYEVEEDPQAAAVDLRQGGLLVVDRLSGERAGVVALTVAQSAAMEYYERIVADLFARTAKLVAVMERRGTVPLGTRRLHRFIAEAMANRSEVASVLHLLDKPDAVWSDPAMDRIYADLRGEFDLGDRYRSVEYKLRSVQESLELILEVARDRRLVLLELTVILLIVMELVLPLFRR
jgi:uncharacterized Rmd1/YagE family protein